MTTTPESIVDVLAAQGCRTVVYVPCSILASISNLLARDCRFDLLLANNEGEAVAIAIGASIRGARVCVLIQNSGLGNAVSPLSSLLPFTEAALLMLIGYRGCPGLDDEPQHHLMGQITEGILDALRIPNTVLSPHMKQDDLAAQFEFGDGPKAVLIPRGTVSDSQMPGRGSMVEASSDVVAFSTAPIVEQPLTRDRAIDAVLEAVDRTAVVIGSTGLIGRTLSNRANPSSRAFAMVGSMGCLPSLALGVSYASPEAEVFALDGDGALLMRLESMATTALYGGQNLTHIVLNNGVHASTGAQPTQAANLDLSAVAQTLGYEDCTRICTREDLTVELSSTRPRSRPRFIEVVIDVDDTTPPRPTTPPFQQWTELVTHLRRI